MYLTFTSKTSGWGDVWSLFIEPGGFIGGSGRIRRVQGCWRIVECRLNGGAWNEDAVPAASSVARRCFLERALGRSWAAAVGRSHVAAEVFKLGEVVQVGKYFKKVVQ